MKLKWFLIASVAGAAWAPSLAGQTNSVKPGINAPYLNSDLNVTEWVERFESEGREVFDNRQELVDAIGLRACRTFSRVDNSDEAAGTEGAS